LTQLHSVIFMIRIILPSFILALYLRHEAEDLTEIYYGNLLHVAGVKRMAFKRFPIFQTATTVPEA